MSTLPPPHMSDHLLRTILFDHLIHIISRRTCSSEFITRVMCHSLKEQVRKAQQIHLIFLYLHLHDNDSELYQGIKYYITIMNEDIIKEYKMTSQLDNIKSSAFYISTRFLFDQ